MSGFHDVTNTRLEISVPAAGLPNMVENPSGALGSWWWQTPIANTNMTVVSGALRFSTSVSQITLWKSAYMAIGGSKWISTRFDTVGGTASHTVRINYECYDANKNLLTTLVLATAYGVTAQTNYAAGVQTHASTAYVKIVFQFYNGTGVTNPSAGANYSMRNVMVTWANTNAFSTVRTNLEANPSLEANTTGWTFTYSSAGAAAASAARSNTLAAVGSWSYRMTPGTDSLTTGMTARLADINISGGQDYATQARFRATSAASGFTAYLTMLWLDGSNNIIGTATASAVYSSGAWTTISKVATAPAGATKLRRVLSVEANGFTPIFGNGNHQYIDAVFTEKDDAVGAYFDGATAAVAGKTYGWTGTANNSTSTETSTSYAFVDPFTWQNVLGPTARISIRRSEMNVGTLQAEIGDAALDPATSSVIKPGARVRLVTSVSPGVWDTVVEQLCTRGTSAYPRDKRPGGVTKTRINVFAVDNNSKAANIPEPRGVGGPAHLPFIMEGRGIPWNCNGSGNQITSAPIVSGKPDATLLDQIGYARDSALGKAWCSRFNVINAWEETFLPITPKATFSDAAGSPLSYVDVDAGYDTDSVINTVTVKWLRYNSSTGQTSEIAYGPYKDQASIDTYGPRKAEFTTHGATEVPSSIASFAASVLAANATPQIIVRSITMSVTDATTLGMATTLDLYDTVNVTYTGKYSGDLRITDIEHEITADKWLVTYRFNDLARIARPTVSIARGYANADTTDTTDGTWLNPTLTNGWVNSGGSDRNVQYMRKNGIVYVEGMAKSGTLNAAAFTLPPGYRPGGQINRSTIASGNVVGRILITGAGVFTPVSGSNTWISFACSFVAEQ